MASAALAPGSSLPRDVLKFSICAAEAGAAGAGLDQEEEELRMQEEEALCGVRAEAEPE